MTRSRLVVMVSAVVVALGAVAAVGAFYLDPARAAVGPLPPEALSLPSDTRYVMGIDVKRFVSSQFYQRYSGRDADKRLKAFQELEEKTGLNPERDVDQVFVAGRTSGTGPRGQDGLVLVLGRFDRYKISRTIETEKKGVTSKNLRGTVVYLFNENAAGRSNGAAAFLNDGALVMGAQPAVEQMIEARHRGEPTLRQNAALLALVESVHPGSTFWMVGDQTLLQNMPRTIPAPGAAPGGSQSIELPAVKNLVVTGDLDPQVALDFTAEASDEAAAKNLADVVRGFVALASLQASQKPELKQLASAVSVTTEAARVRVAARFPYELIDALQAKPRAGVAPTVPAPPLAR